MVVRLKGGDPSVFGRLEEELRGAGRSRHRLRGRAGRHRRASPPPPPTQRPLTRRGSGRSVSLTHRDDARRRAARHAQRRHRGVLHGRPPARRAVAPPAATPAGRPTRRSAWCRAPAGPTSSHSDHRVRHAGAGQRAARRPADGGDRGRRCARDRRRRSLAEPPSARCAMRWHDPQALKSRLSVAPRRCAHARSPQTMPALMTHVVTESCIRCKYTDCVDVCPVDCFREGPNMLIIDPDECIDCAVCIPECPVNAILPEEDVPRRPAALHQAQRRAVAQGLAEHHQAQAGAGRRRRMEGQDGQAVRADPLNRLRWNRN